MRVVRVRGYGDVNQLSYGDTPTSNRDRRGIGQNGGDQSGKSYWSPRPYGNRGLYGCMASSMTREFCTKSTPQHDIKAESDKVGMVRVENEAIYYGNRE